MGPRPEDRGKLEAALKSAGRFVLDLQWGHDPKIVENMARHET